MATQIQVRRDSSTNWSSSNPTLAQGEIGYETNTGYLKVGDGSTAWNSLSYLVRTQIDGFDDVVVTSVADNELLAYDSSSSRWINQTPSEAGFATVATSGAYSDLSGTPTNVSSFTNDAGYLTSFTETNDLSSAVTWANVPDANITESSVTQHQAALSLTESQISDLQAYLTSVSVDGLSDATITTPADNEVLAYDSTSSEWINQTASEAGLATSSQGALADTALQPADLSVTTNSAGTAALTYTSGTGVFSYTPPDLSSYLTAESDTLDSVTGRGNSTSNSITVGDATVTGNLTVQGTTTTLNTATLDVEDKNITINYSTGDSSGSADGAGITIQDAVNSTTDATILWDATGDKFEFSHAMDVAGNITLTGTVDGRDIATDGTKLDGIEAGADVTDATNVAAAGAVMDGDFTSNGFMKRTGSGTYTVDTNTYLTSVSVDGLSDATITTPADNELLAYDSTSSEWINQTPAEAGFATVATSGAYSDLSGTPTNVSTFTNDAGYLTGNQTISLSGDLSGSGTTSIDAQIAANVVGANELNVSGNGTTAQFLRSDGDGTFTWATPTDTNTTYTGDGNYGITISGTAIRLETDHRINSSTTDVYNGNTHDFTFYDASVGIRWYTAGAEEMRLTDAGTLHVDGDVVAYSTTVSDQRLKDDVEVIGNALEKISNLRGVTYTWNAGSREGQRDMGVIAQEVEAVIPEIVYEKEMALIDGETYKTVDYEKLTAVLIEAVKELKTEVDSLKAAQ